MSSILRRSLERRTLPPNPFNPSALSISAPGSSFGSSAGVGVSDSTAMGIIAFYAGLRIMSQTVSTTPVRAVTVSSDATRKPVVPSPDAIVNPFWGVSLVEGISQIVTSLILRGNAFLWVAARDPKTFKPSNLRVLSPDRVSVGWDRLGEREYTINGKAYSGDYVIQLSGFMLPGAAVGAGIIEYCRNALGIGIALEDVAGRYFANGLMTTGIISVDAPLNDEQSRQVSEQFQSRHSGTKRSFKPIVLGGGAKFEPISLTLEDAQFIQSRQFSEGQMATLLGIPPHLLGIVDRTTSWGTGIEVQGRAFVDYTLRPFFTALQSMFTSFLPDGMFSEFITDVITRADTATRYANYNLAMGNGVAPAWMCTDDVRALEGLPPLPDGKGQIFYVPAALSPAGSSPTIPTTPIPATDPSTGGTNAGDEN